MRGSICKCIYSQFIEHPVTITSIVLDFLLSLLIIISGLILNQIYQKKLREEKRLRPLDRKGNVIEPIMSWYLTFSFVFWPFEMILLWINTNEILPAQWFTHCWLGTVIFNFMRIGRTIIAFNSFFLVLIRYLYIVHQQKANQWNFEKTGRVFQIASFAVPLALEIVRFFTEYDVPGLKSTERFQTCVAVNEGWENSTRIEHTPVSVVLAQQLLPAPLIFTIYCTYVVIVFVVGSNVFEAFFYLRIFQTIDR